MSRDLQDGADQAVLEVRNVGKKYGVFRALHEINFDLRPGEVHALLGENGAGKSTLIKILAGIERPTEGDLVLDGERISIKSPRESTDLGFAVLHQQPEILGRFSAFDNITLGLKGSVTGRGVLAHTSRELRQVVSAVAEQVGVTFDLKIAGRQLSTQQAQLVALARALLAKARIVIMDEPTAMLSAREVDRLEEICRRLRDSGVGVIYVTHYLEEALGFADRITVLRDGRKVRTAPKAGVRDKAQLIEWIVGRRPEQSSDLSTAQDGRIGDVALEARGLSYGEQVRGVSLTVRRGEVVGITGLVGAGGSELGAILASALRPEVGEIYIFGQRYTGRSPRAAIRRGVVLLPEDRRAQAALSGRSVRENATLASLRRYRAAGVFMNPRKERRHVRAHAKRMRISMASTEAPLRSLSGGNQQKVMAARCIDAGAQVYILQEPTQGVDVGARDEIHKIVRELASAGAAVVVISSDVDEVCELGDRVLAMRSGEIVAELPGARAKKEHVLAICYGGEPEGFALASSSTPGVASEEASSDP